MAKTIEELGDLRAKRVILRCDFNVPIDQGKITDPGRIIAALPTIKFLLAAGASVVIISHLGRPDGEVVAEYSLEPVSNKLAELLEAPVKFASDTVGESAREQLSKLGAGEVLLLENLRFNPEETSKSESDRLAFAQKLADFADFYVSDGFGVVHRKQASVYELAKLLPAAAGKLVTAEVKVLSRLVEAPEREFTVVLGGSKVSDKLAVIDNLLPKVDNMLIGGAMLFTFLAAKGYKTAKSLVELDQIETVKGYLAKAEQLGVNLVLPTDIVVAETFAKDAAWQVLEADKIEESQWAETGIGLDIGPQTAAKFADIIAGSKTVFWNGPMGVFEFENFSAGTKTVAEALSKVAGLSVVGGGDSAAAIRLLGFTDEQFGHVSTGGGASLEYLEGKKLPGLEVLGWQ